jgi:hypothetical protein
MAADSYGQAVEDGMKALSQYHASDADIEKWLRQAVVNLCPQYKAKLP